MKRNEKSKFIVRFYPYFLVFMDKYIDKYFETLEDAWEYYHNHKPLDEDEYINKALCTTYGSAHGIARHRQVVEIYPCDKKYYYDSIYHKDISEQVFYNYLKSKKNETRN